MHGSGDCELALGHRRSNSAEALSNTGRGRHQHGVEASENQLCTISPHLRTKDFLQFTTHRRLPPEDVIETEKAAMQVMTTALVQQQQI